MRAETQSRTIERSGRTRYSEKATCTITVRPDRRALEPYFVLHGAHIRIEENYQIIEVMHPTGTDFEHDAASIVLLELWCTQFKGIDPYLREVEFEAVLAEAKYYPDDIDPTNVPDDYHVAGQMCEADWCEDEHPLMRYQPPEQPWTPKKVLIEVRFA